MTITDNLRAKIRRALSITGTHSYTDWCGAVLDGETRVYSTDDTVVSVLYETYPQSRACRIWIAAGTLAGAEALLPRIEADAIEQGCTEMIVEGRRGWERVGPRHGYALRSVVMSKRLAARQEE